MGSLWNFFGLPDQKVEHPILAPTEPLRTATRVVVGFA